MGFPIRKSTDQRVFAPPRSLSQRITSFIACACQGIHQLPLRHLIVLIANAHPGQAPNGIGTKRPASRDRFEGAVRQTHHMREIERLPRQITNLSAHEVRTNLLFTMSNRTSGEPRSSPQTFLRMTDLPLYTRYWWSRTGSNRRHPACKAGALPAELRPLIPFVEEMVGLGGLEPPTSRLSSARSNQLSYKPEHGPTDRPPCTTAQHAPTDAKRHGLVREEREKKTAVSRLWGL